MESYGAPSFISEVVSKWRTQHLAQNLELRLLGGYLEKILTVAEPLSEIHKNINCIEKAK